jgi:hypothetical protein
MIYLILKISRKKRLEKYFNFFLTPFFKKFIFFLKIIVNDWDKNDIGEFLKIYKLDPYIECFKNENITGISYLYIKEIDLAKNFNMTQQGDIISFI